MATEMKENSDDEDFVQERDNRRRQRLPEGGRHNQSRVERRDRLDADELSPPRDLDRLQRAMARNRRRNQTPSVSPVQDQSPPVSPVQEQSPPVSPMHQQSPTGSPVHDQSPQKVRCMTKFLQ